MQRTATEGTGVTHENTEENRHAYRKVFFETPDFNKSIGGVILHAETLLSEPTVQPLVAAGVVLGIKTDKGLKAAEGLLEGEQSTKEGLVGLEERSKEFYAKGARFAKWRTVLALGKDMPSQASYDDVSDVLAEYALVSQKVLILHD